MRLHAPRPTKFIQAVIHAVRCNPCARGSRARTKPPQPRAAHRGGPTPRTTCATRRPGNASLRIRVIISADSSPLRSRCMEQGEFREWALPQRRRSAYRGARCSAFESSPGPAYPGPNTASDGATGDAGLAPCPPDAPSGGAMTFDHEKLIEPIAAVAAANAASVDAGQFPTETMRALGEAGLLGLISAAEVGGRGLGLPAAAAVVERLARECGSTAMVLCMHYCATAVIEELGPRDVRTAIAAGKHLTTLALSEVGSRSQFWVPMSTATLDGNDVILTARKSFATSAHNADSYVW